jgi:hypothetical protein
MAHPVERVRTLMAEARLPRDDRAAARAERRVEDAIRREREHVDEHARILAAAEAERRRWSDGGRLR